MTKFNEYLNTPIPRALTEGFRPMIKCMLISMIALSAYGQDSNNNTQATSQDSVQETEFQCPANDIICEQYFAIPSAEVEAAADICHQYANDLEQGAYEMDVSEQLQILGVVCDD